MTRRDPDRDRSSGSDLWMAVAVGVGLVLVLLFVGGLIMFRVRTQVVRAMAEEARARDQAELATARAAAAKSAAAAQVAAPPSSGLQPPASGLDWPCHVVHALWPNSTAIAADFTGDGVNDVMSSGDGKTWLFVAPDWEPVVVDATPDRECIHSEVFDVDSDGDPDFIGARYSPGLVFWLERPADPLGQPWPYHLVDEKIDGIHGLLAGDVDRDGKLDLLANSAQPEGPFANSLVWLRVPENPREAPGWDRFVFADHDAPGLSHYLGFGDIDGDGRGDAASAAKGGPTAAAGTGDWFAWWQAPEDPQQVWTKHIVAIDQPGATNIHPADVNADGKVDLVASCGHGQGVYWFEAPDWKRHEIHATLKGPHCLVVADLDADGDPDAATCAKDDRLAVWFENDGKGGFASHIIGRNQAAYDIRAVDMNGDQRLDLLIAGQDSANIVWYENVPPR